MLNDVVNINILLSFKTVLCTIMLGSLINIQDFFSSLNFARCSGFWVWPLPSTAANKPAMSLMVASLNNYNEAFTVLCDIQYLHSIHNQIASVTMP